MFEKVSQLAEEAATKVSRREFLSRLGGAALSTAGAVAGILALPAIGEAGRKRPAMCGQISDSQCVNQPVGTTCQGTLSFVGQCKQIHKSTSCYCG